MSAVNVAGPTDIELPRRVLDPLIFHHVCTGQADLQQSLRVDLESSSHEAAPVVHEPSDIHAGKGTKIHPVKDVGESEVVIGMRHAGWLRLETIDERDFVSAAQAFALADHQVHITHQAKELGAIPLDRGLERCI